MGANILSLLLLNRNESYDSYNMRENKYTHNYSNKKTKPTKFYL
jgi:hypothetical protein